MRQPERIGRYRVERLLGTGSFATVWLGHDETLDAWVAIKVLAENWSHDLRVRERFVEEARILWRLDDEHLLRVHTVDELADGRPYAVLTWADGGSLRDRLADGPLDVVRCLDLLHDVAAGVQRLHDEQIVHRDLTPGNILFRTRADGREQVLVADLGLAKELAAASGLTARAGTPGFMAPEQDSEPAQVDERTDVYGLGRLAIALLTEPDRSAPQGWRLRPGVPAGIRDVLRTATATDPQERYPDAADLGRALAGVRRPAPADDASSAGRPDSAGRRPARRRHRRTQVAAAAGVVLAAAAAAVWLLPGDGPTAAAGPLLVTLPDGWSAAGTGWSGRAGADGEPEPALVVAPDPAAWATDTDMPGAFVGLSTTLAARTTPDAFVARQRHDQCDGPTTEHVRLGAITWTVATFDGCTSGKAQVVEAAATTSSGTELVYAQVAPPADGGQDFTVTLLAGIDVAP